MLSSRWITRVHKAPVRVTKTRLQRTLADSPLIRPLGEPDPAILAQDFQLLPHFYNLSETRQLLAAALWKLDRGDSTRRRRRTPNTVPDEIRGDAAPLADLFHGEYGFEPGHYDAVIHQYRETLMSNLPPASTLYPDLESLLNRAYALLPSSPQIHHGQLPKTAISHLLHLAPEGEIKGHVDNLDASGGVILGICLGADRILRLGKQSGDGQVGWDVRLGNGTVYLQQGKLRYEYEHSILPYDSPGSNWDGERLVPGHRVSIMIRDAPRSSSDLKPDP